jgi:hypothetical protein
VEEPADGVVDGLRLGEGLVATLVGNDPKTSSDKTGSYGIGRPESETSGSIQVRVREVEGVDEWVGVLDALVEATQEEEVPDTVGRKRRQKRRPCSRH